jgi:diguanylate cyclase
MKYHDSIKIAQSRHDLALKQLKLWFLAPTPINYAVSYEYIIGDNQKIIEPIKQQLSSGKALNNFLLEQLYQDIILGQASFRDEIITDIDILITGVQKSNQQSSRSVNEFIKQVDSNIDNFRSNNSKKITYALNQIEKASLQFKRQQQQLSKQLIASKEQSISLQNELEEVRKDIYLDPLTGLYNHKAFNHHIDLWTSADPNKQVAAIVINIDELGRVKQQFGGLISDVLLSKIAHKINSYVGESGLPVRSGSDEFVILLPEVEHNIVTEIAEKIRQGVEKLRFINNKSGIRLPKMTVSLGVTDFNLSQNVESVLHKARTVVNNMQLKSHNKMVIIR